MILFYFVSLNPKTNTATLQLVVPTSLQSEILTQLHTSPSGGLLGKEKTLSKLKSHFHWPGHYNDVINWCLACLTCSTRKCTICKGKAPMSPIIVGNVLQLVATDIIGPLHFSCS